ncbi:hypothetical protein DFH07DRAFT_977387 [Mycena maculata]|uniref:Uncharacterized protein n=1 Tax=Mycena maculata TaxID=230809 RepID=A0AAD7IL19_9AGAR|nr:hypothetical protein DFH07DRAFT_977387 [Mycena maculata]
MRLGVSSSLLSTNYDDFVVSFNLLDLLDLNAIRDIEASMIDFKGKRWMPSIMFRAALMNGFSIDILPERVHRGLARSAALPVRASVGGVSIHAVDPGPRHDLYAPHPGTPVVWCPQATCVESTLDNVGTAVAESILFHSGRETNTPAHGNIIRDGHRWWARQSGQPVLRPHGNQGFGMVAKIPPKHRAPCATEIPPLLGFSSEKPGQERDGLFALMTAESKTSLIHLFRIAVGYGGREEILSAVRHLVDKGKDYTEQNISMETDCRQRGVPPVDLIIRTSERRTNGYQKNYSPDSFIMIS